MNEITTIGLDLAKHVFPGTRGRCSGGDGSAQAASTSAGSGVLQSTAALSGGDGGMCDGALLGAGVERGVDPWVIGLRRRRPSLVVAVALANKTARIAWAVMHQQENYQRMATAA